MIKDREGILRHQILTHGSIKAKNVLDIGCGNGVIAGEIAEYASRVTGIDPDPDMLERAKAHNRNRSNTTFLDAKIESFDPHEEMYDVVLFNRSLHHIDADQHYTALEEAHRIPNHMGKMLIIEPVYLGGAYQQISNVYNDEEKVRVHAIKMIHAATEKIFNLERHERFEVIYRCRDFSDLYGDEIKPKSWVMSQWKDEWRTPIEQILEQCNKDASGDYVLDYHLYLWVLAPKKL